MGQDLHQNLAKFSNLTDIFSINLAIELFENMEMNEHVNELIGGKQPPYRPIYTLSLVELKTLKLYLETYLKTGFI